MGLITDALHIGRSALLAYQSALQVVGNNIANAGTPGYVRQTPQLTPTAGIPLPEGFSPGGGVALTSLKRNVDDALEQRIRVATGDQAQSTVEQQMLGRIESIMNELTDADLSTLLQGFFNAFSTLQTKAQDQTTRGLVIASGERVVGEVQRQRQEVLSLRDQINQDIDTGAEQINEILGKVADLNTRVTAAESSSAGGANSLRDQRDQLLRELGELVEIEVREQPDGGVNVYIGNEQAVQAGLSRGITASLDTTDGVPRAVVRFADNNGPVALKGGKLAGLVAARDEHVVGQVEALDDLAAVLIREVNRVHSQGQGLQAFTSASGTYDVLDADAVLNSTAAGLDFPPRNGSFLVTVKDRSGGTSTTTSVIVDLDGIGADDTLNSLVAQINAKVGNVTASVTADRRLSLTAANGFEFTISEDSSNFMAGMGVNTFFSGHDAQDIAVNAVVARNPNMIAAGTNGNPGDGSNAGSLASLATRGLSDLNGQSVIDYYNGIVSDVAIKGAAAQAGVEASQAINSALTAQRESISGVSLDEETISLLRFQRSFQAAAQYTSVVDQLIQEMLNIVR